jgi:uncharacterized protein DUF6984
MKSSRPITPFEASLINRIVNAGSGRYHAVPTLADERVSELPAEGTIRFTAYRSDSSRKYPIEAEAADVDGILIHALLFVNNDGCIAELELYKEDGSPIADMPPAEAWTIVDLPSRPPT